MHIYSFTISLFLFQPNYFSPKDHSPPGSSVHGILQARILEWVAMPSSRGIFPTQWVNPCFLRLLQRQAGSLPLESAGRPPEPVCRTLFGNRLIEGVAMTYLDSILKSTDITLPTKVHLVKAMVFPVVIYGCESWTIKKAEHWQIDTFELWCWRRLLRVPWTARRYIQFTLKEISPEYLS